MNLERWNRQIEFILEADREKQIERQTHICGYSRREGKGRRCGARLAYGADGVAAAGVFQ